MCVRIEAPPSETERLIGELYALGTLGIEERDETLLAYFSPARLELSSLEALARASVVVHAPEPVPAVDWERSWRAGLGPRRVGALWIRPSWCASVGQPELVIDPEQAFGSGEHASTRLALTLLLEGLEPGARVLDVGGGSGILGLAALRRGAGAALGVDIERQACRTAAANRRRNGLPLALVAGTLDALDPRASFDRVVANLLFRRLEALLPRLARLTRGRLVLSGYLAAERRLLSQRVAAQGLTLSRQLEETQTEDRWCASAWDSDPCPPVLEQVV